MATTPTTGSADSPRERIVLAASGLLRTRGYSGTSMRDIVEAAEAPWGSLQHYFPGGKDQIVIEAMATGAARVDEMIGDAFRRTRSAEGAVRSFFTRSAETMEERDFEAGCPVGLAAMEHASQDDEIARLGRETFEHWQALFAGALRADGIEPRAARRIATTIITQYEGAAILSRVGHDATPLRTAGTVMSQLVAASR